MRLDEAVSFREEEKFFNFFENLIQELGRE